MSAPSPEKAFEGVVSTVIDGRGSEINFIDPKAMVYVPAFKSRPAALFIGDDNFNIYRYDLKTSLSAPTDPRLHLIPSPLSTCTERLTVIAWELVADLPCIESLQAICVESNAESVSLLISDGSSHCIRRLRSESLIDAAEFDGAFGIPRVLWTLISEFCQQWAMSVLAGQGMKGHIDGAGPEARFDDPRGIVSDGRLCYVADSWNANLRTIDLATGVVATAAGSGSWGDGDSDEPLSAAFTFPFAVACACDAPARLFVVCSNKLRCFDRITGDVTTVHTHPKVIANCIQCTPSGHIIATSWGHLQTHCIYEIDCKSQTRSLTGVGERGGGFADGAASTARFDEPAAIALVAEECAAYICDAKNRRIRRLTLSPKYFVPPTTADATAAS